MPVLSQLGVVAVTTRIPEAIRGYGSRFNTLRDPVNNGAYQMYHTINNGVADMAHTEPL